MIRAIFFDMGGTLDGDGLHWLDRFAALYNAFGSDLTWDSIRGAFDEAERRSALDDRIMTSSFEETIALHVSWQFEHLNLQNPALKQHLIQGFITSVGTAVRNNVAQLRMLTERGFQLGVVSNGCGNVDRICQDFGYTPFLAVIVDSRRVRLFKPDPAIFVHAAKEIGADPTDVMMVGDSFDRDVRPAKKIGMKTAWLEGLAPRPCPDPSLIDIRLRRLADLAGALSATQSVRA